MAFTITCDHEGELTERKVDSWINDVSNHHLYIGINTGQHLPNFQGNRVHKIWWPEERKMVYLAPPAGSEVLPVPQWRSNSAGSEAFYPLVWRLAAILSNNPVEIAVQFLRGKTSCHCHQQTVQQMISIRGQTKVWREGYQSDVLSRRPLIFEPGQHHQLHRLPTPGLTINLVCMHGPFRFPDRKDYQFRHSHF